MQGRIDLFIKSQVSKGPNFKLLMESQGEFIPLPGCQLQIFLILWEMLGSVNA